MFPDLRLIDRAVSGRELARWQARALAVHGEQSTAVPEEEARGELMGMVSRLIRLPLIHILLFAIEAGHETEIHKDGGEYVALFYPFDSSAGLRLQYPTGHTQEIDVKKNRLILLACSDIGHQQIIPGDGSVRYSVAFKFRLPVPA